MVFFTSILIVAILYYLQTNGLIFVAIIAVVGELINIFMAQTMSKEAEKKTVAKFAKVIQNYRAKIDAQKSTIRELEDIQEDSVIKVLSANKKIKEYEEKLGISEDQSSSNDNADGPGKGDPEAAQDDSSVEDNDISFKDDDLPDGSNRKKLPI